MEIRQWQKGGGNRSCVVTTVALPADMLEALDREGERTQIRNRSALVRQAVQEFLDRQKQRRLAE